MLRIGVRAALAMWLACATVLAAEAQEDTSTEDVTGGAGSESVAAPTGEPAQAQSGVQSAVLVLNQERLFSQSVFGQRVASELEAAARELSRENREIEQQLTEEELRLTELRPTTDVAEFRAMAEEFDIRVEAIRDAQEAKGRDLQAQAEAAQARFFDLVTPILLDLARGRGAAVVLDSRSVFLSAGAIDITNAAVERINAELGDGGTAPLIDLGFGETAPQDGADPAPQPASPGE